MKKRVSIVLTVLCLAVISVFALVACGEEATGPNVQNDGLSYELYGDGYAVTRYFGMNNEVEIPATYGGKNVIKVADKAFYQESRITSVKLPETIVSIGNEAFYACQGLEKINIPENVTSIGDKAFMLCEKIAGIDFPDKITYIGSDAFNSCRGIINITLPDSLTRIESGTFVNCCRLRDLKIPNSVTEIGSHAFESCTGLMSVTIPASITGIGEYAFGWCYRLVEVRNLSAIEIDKGSENGGCVAYYANDVYVDETTPSKISENNGFVIYNETDGTKSLINYIGSEEKPIIQPEITGIRKYAFYQVEGVTEIEIPDRMTRIEEFTFAGCCDLRKVTIPDSVTDIDMDAFMGCVEMKNITIPESVTIISSGVFAGCNNLETIYCEAESRPKGWDGVWDSFCPAEVVWNYNGGAAV